jgi:TolA-binding protein
MRRALLSLTSAASISFFALPVIAQTLPVETRVDRLEKEMRAVQRKVFPSGAPVQPDIAGTPAATVAGNSANPVADLTSRVDSLETQLASLTGQVEQNNFRLKKLEDAFAKYKLDTEARLNPAAAVVAPAPATPAVAAVAAPAVKPAVATPVVAAVKPVPPAKPAATAAPKTAAKPAASATAEARKTAVAAIERPASGDNADDAYNYGYRLWEAKFYPEAQVQLKATVEKFGSTSVGSHAQNLLGRAYLDDGKPALASVAFYENYQKRPRGKRAADSLAYLGEALLQLKKPADACKVYSELSNVYGANLKPKLKDMMDKGRVRAKCGA